MADIASKVMRMVEKRLLCVASPTAVATNSTTASVPMYTLAVVTR